MKMKIVSVSLVIFFGSIIPLSYVHELGHSYVCMMEGYDFDLIHDISKNVSILNGFYMRVLLMNL